MYEITYYYIHEHNITIAVADLTNEMSTKRHIEDNGYVHPVHADRNCH